MLWTILLNGPLLLGGYWAARDGFGQPRGAARWLAAAVISWAWVTLGMQTLGAVGLMTRGPLLGWSLLGAGLGWATGRIRREPSGEAFPSGDPRWQAEATVGLGLTLWVSALMGMRSLLLPVKVVSDGPIYHLWFAARWWKAGALELVAAPFGDNVVTYFPANGDLWLSWLMIGWGGDLLAKAGQAPFHAMTWLASYAMARQVGAGRSAAVIASGWMVTASPFLVFGFEANVDTILQAGYLAAAFFFLRYAMRDGGGEAIALGALAAGCCWGCKPTGLVLVPPILAAVGLAVLLRPIGPRAKLGHLAMLAALPMLTAGFWYVRNLWLSGNPLYPVQVELFGRTVLTGWYAPEVMKGSRYYIDPANWRAGVDILLQVLDPRMTPLWFGALAGLWALGRGRDGGRGRWAWAAAALAVLDAAIYWGVIPYRTQQRFLFPAVGLMAVPLALLLDRARGLRILGVALLAVHLLTPQAWPWAGAGEEEAVPWDLSPLIPNTMAGTLPLVAPGGAWRASASAALDAGRTAELAGLVLAVAGPPAVGAAAMLAAWAMGRAIRCSGAAGPRLAAGGGIAGVLVAAGLVAYPWGYPEPLRFFPAYPDYYRGWVALDRLAGPEGARIAYSGTNLPYYLLGPGMRNTVRYVNINAHPGWLLHDYHRQAVRRGQPNWPGDMPGWDREEQDPDAWLANLRAEGIELLVVARHNPGEPWPVERRWADERPGIFRLSYGGAPEDPLFRVYRVGPSP
ncbi:glycosyltransferase family 39 protein [Tautonia sociabilis]|uniref:4-amino-4-deoxy-L-arabinose transferase n=1 Tax=Tautonia sociabilis TaxID=2080755 RepID=A0A432MGM2_9BACT|nr:glycosyltransferase family 39 protein [Tautonia sociabilis]RUL85842.1 4-amino-4-deoxy-L-arabinose transferase [Tautonia sociabilis]